jgi:hypothetical protein
LTLFSSGEDDVVNARLGDWVVVYEACTIIWITFGLGYVFMIITVIADNLRRPARKAIKKIKVAEKIMTERIVQELLSMKEKDR